jgi:hypothetical protein
MFFVMLIISCSGKKVLLLYSVHKGASVSDVRHLEIALSQLRKTALLQTGKI